MANPNPNTSGLKKPWEPGQSGNPNGRPRDPAKEMLEAALGKKGARKFARLSKANKDDIDSILESATTDFLMFVAKWDGATAYAKGRALAILNDMKKGQTHPARQDKRPPSWPADAEGRADRKRRRRPHAAQNINQRGNRRPS